MSESVKGKHTPGPWKFLKEFGRVEAEKKIVCYLPGGVTAAEMEESIQNGPLIAAAPDLLEALKRIRDGTDFCECDHSTNDCCALQHPVDFVCPYCIADIAIKAAEGLL